MSGGHGGSRAGAGRKRGGKNLKTREIADKATAEGITPLEVMLGAMRERWDTGDKVGASAIARDAAPYCHPRLQAIEHGGPNGGAIRMVVSTGIDREDDQGIDRV